jgi:2-C-methyl-D-erythritol 4-phosphate cytidylyltransferase
MSNFTAAAILPCAGIGSRVGASRPKQFLDLAGKPVFLWSLDVLLAHEAIGEVVLVLGSGEEDALWGLLEASHQLAVKAGRIRLAQGGAERWMSVRNGVLACGQDPDLVLVHDVARPFLHGSDVDAALEAAAEDGACTLALQATDTIKWAGPGKEPVVERTMDRRRIWLTQTPQAFRRSLLLECYRRPDLETMELTDEAGLVERCGESVRLVPGSDRLRKITGPEDLEWARWMAGREAIAQRHAG